MRKLFLTSFLFDTGENTYNEYRLVVVDESTLSDDHARDVATKKAMAWFALDFPQSKLRACIVHPAIEALKTQSGTNGIGLGYFQNEQGDYTLTFNDKPCGFVRKEKHAKLIRDLSDDLGQSWAISKEVLSHNQKLLKEIEGWKERFTIREDDQRSNRERVVDELINDIDPNANSVILSYLKRNRTKQID